MQYLYAGIANIKNRNFLKIFDHAEDSARFFSLLARVERALGQVSSRNYLKDSFPTTWL